MLSGKHTSHVSDTLNDMMMMYDINSWYWSKQYYIKASVLCVRVLDKYKNNELTSNHKQNE